MPPIGPMSRALSGLCLGACLALSLWSPVGAGEPGTPPHLLVLNKHDDSLMVFDLPSHRLTATITVGDEPHEVAVTPDGAKAYVSNVGDRSITVIDLQEWSVLRTITPERIKFPHGLGITHDGRLLVVTSEGSRRFYLFETERDVLVRAITSTEKGMHMIAMPPRGKKAYVANRTTGSLTVLDAKRLSIKDHIRVGSGPEGIALTPDGRLLLVALQHAGEVIMMKPGRERVLARVATGRTPIRIAVTPDGSLALVANRDSNDVTFIDLESRSVRTTIPVGSSPGGLAITPDGLQAYVCNNDSNTVSVVSISAMRVTGALDTGAHPDGIAIVPGIAPRVNSGGKHRRSSESDGRS